MFIHDLKSTSEARMRDFEHEASVRQADAAIRKEHPSTPWVWFGSVRRVRFRSPIHLQPSRIEQAGANFNQSPTAQ